MNKLVSTSIVNLAISLGTAVTSILIARLYGAELRGSYAVILAVVNTSVSIGMLGTPAYLARLISNSENINRGFSVVKAIYITIFIGTIVSYIGYYALTFTTSEAYSGTVTTILMLYIPLCVISIVYLNIGLGQNNWVSFNIGRLSFVLVSVLYIMLCGLLLDGELIDIFFGLLLGNVVAIIMQYFLTKKIIRSEGSLFTTFKKLYYNSRHYALNSVTNVSTGYLDFIVLASLLNNTIIGYWAVARTISALLSPINHALSITVFAGRLQNSKETNSELKSIVFKFLTFNFFSILLLLLFSNFIVLKIFGEEFSASIELVPLALASSFFAALSEIFEESLRGCGRPGPVNLSRVIPILFLTCIYFYAQGNMTINDFAILLIISQCIRCGLAIISEKICTKS